MTAPLPSRLRPPVHAAPALALLAALLAPTHALALTATLYGGPTLEIVETSPGVFAPVGYLNPSMAYTLPGSSSGGASAGVSLGLGSAQYIDGTAILGQRGIAMTPTGTYTLGTLGANSVAGWTPVGSASSTATATNASGMIVGSSTLYSVDGTANFGGRAVWYAPGSATPNQLQLPASGFTDSAGWGISGVSNLSSTGIVVGFATQFDGDTSLGMRALRWNSVTAAPEVLGKLPGYSEWGENTSTPVAVNAAGTAIGWGNTFTASNQYVGASAIRWDAGTTTATDLGHLGTSQTGEYSSRATAINSAGVVVGHADSYSATHQYQGETAVRWAAHSTQATQLGHLGRNADGESFSQAVAINDAGTVAGVSIKFNQAGQFLGQRAVRWTADGTEAHELALLSQGAQGESFSYVFGMNAAGFMVGSANIVGTDSNAFGDPDAVDVHAVLWTPDGAVVDLNTLLPANSGWTLYGAYAISDSGWITGIGWYTPEGQSSDYAYTRLYSLQLAAVPEPATFALMGLGVAGLLLRRRLHTSA